MSSRVDLLDEIDVSLNNAGQYTGEWLDSSGIKSVWVTSNSTAAMEIDYSQDGTVLSANNCPNASEQPLLTRWFRIRAVSGAPNATFRCTVRVSEFL